jgi:hypothetical protein
VVIPTWIDSEMAEHPVVAQGPQDALAGACRVEIPNMVTGCKKLLQESKV